MNDDGAPDLVLTHPDGRVSILLNDTLAARAAVPEVPTKDLQELAGVRIASVHVKGERGVVGAHVILKDATGAPLARHRLANNIATGCRGPDQCDLVARRPGIYTVEVRFSDGAVVEERLDLTAALRQRVILTRPAPASQPVPPN